MKRDTTSSWIIPPNPDREGMLAAGEEVGAASFSCIILAWSLGVTAEGGGVEGVFTTKLEAADLRVCLCG